jgi:enolase
MIEVDVITEGGAIGRGSASTGTSVGMYESYVLRDNDPKRFEGLSVFKAIDNVNHIIGPAIIGMDVMDQSAIDRKMIEMDGTPYKSYLGGNSIYSVSIACIKAAANTMNMALYKYMAPPKIKTLPVPTFNSINGGHYPDLTMSIQEFTFVPYKAENMEEAVEISSAVFKRIGEVIEKYQGGKEAGIGHAYGWRPPCEDPEVCMELLNEAVEQCGYSNKVAYALDCASSEMYDEETKTYYFNKRRIEADEMIDFIKKLTQKYNFLYVEDILEQNDWDGYMKAVREIDKTIIIGDDFIVTNLNRLKKAYELHAVDGFIFKPNQVGTITESLEAHQFARDHGMITVPSQRGGGAVDDVVMDICIAIEAQAVKNSAPRSGERIYALNSIYRAADENPDAKLFDFSKITKF